jgi:nitrile hydratase subunit alpha
MNSNHRHEERKEEIALRVKAIESLLVEKGLLDPTAIDKLIDLYEHKIGPRNGAKVVAKHGPIQNTKNVC